MSKRTVIPILALLLALTASRFPGRAVRFEAPDGYQVLEAADGSVFVYHESRPGFLALYRQEGDVAETLTALLNATANVRRTETPLEVEIGGQSFTGLFVETETGDRIFLAAAEGWALVAQGPAGDWPGLAAGLNQVLRSLAFEEGR